MIQQYDPLGIFEQPEYKSGICEIKGVLVSLTAATANQLVVTAVTGKKIRVLSGAMYTDGVQNYVIFKSASGGTSKASYSIPANTSAIPNVQIPFNLIGEFETNSGEGLYADNAAASIITVFIRYIEVVP